MRGSVTKLGHVTSIEDLPELALVEIFCRLPRTSAFRCKSVCKGWLALISDPYFVGRFESRQQCLPIFSNNNNRKQKMNYITLTPNDNLRRQKRSFSLNFLPGTRKFEPHVVGTYKDLVCCYAYEIKQYFVCNPYSKKYVSLPPPPRCVCRHEALSCPHKIARVGFICTSYKEKLNDHDDQIPTSDVDQESLRYKVVRIAPQPRLDHYYLFSMQIFSSETGKWEKSEVVSPRAFVFQSLAQEAGVAHNGMLYWRGPEFIVELDPYSKKDTRALTHGEIACTYCFRIIDKPNDEVGFGTLNFLGVSRGCLRACEFFSYPDQFESFGLSIWEYKHDEVVKSGTWSLVQRIFLDQMISKNPVIAKWGRGRSYKDISVQHFDPNNDHILYLELFQHLVTCNIQTGKLKEVETFPYKYRTLINNADTFREAKRVFPIAIPWCPTPVPSI